MLNSSASASGSNHTARRRIGGMGPVEIVAEKLLFGARDCAAVAETASQFQRQAASSLGQVVEKQSSSFGLAVVCLFLAANRHLVKIHEESCKTVGGFKSLTDFKSWVRKVQDHLISKSIALTANAAVEGGSSSSGGSGSTPGLNTARSSALVGSSAIRTAIQGLSPALNDRTASPSSKSPAVSAKLTPNQKLNNTFVTKTPFSGDSPSSSTLSNSNQNISDPEPHFKTLCLKTGSADLLRHVVELHKVFWPRYISSLTLGEQNLLRHNPDHEFWCSQIVYACSKAINVKIEKSIFTGFCGRDSKTFDKFQEKVKEICKEELKTIGEMKSQLQSSIKKARQKSNSTKTGDGNDNKSPTTAVAAGEAPVEEEAELDDDGNPLEKLVNCVSRKRANHAGHDQSKRSKTSFTGINSMINVQKYVETAKYRETESWRRGLLARINHELRNLATKEL